jgi:hypothetical protein
MKIQSTNPRGPRGAAKRRLGIHRSTCNWYVHGVRVRTCSTRRSTRFPLGSSQIANIKCAPLYMRANKHNIYQKMKKGTTETQTPNNQIWL